MPNARNNKKALTLSIIIPAYNEEDYIADCLKAIAAQTVRPHEVIVVDNNSTDRTVEIAQSFPFVQVITESKQGIVYARDTGFDAARSDVLGRIDADTQVNPLWVESVIDLASKNDQQTAFTGACTFRDWRGKMLLFWGHRILFFWSSYMFLGHHTLFGSNMFIPRSLWRSLRKDVCIRNDIHEDMDLSIHVRKVGGTIQFSKAMQATISPRRIYRMWHYPRMWFKTKLVHRPC